MLKEEKRAISGENGENFEYTVKQFPAMKSMRVAIKLAKTLGGGIAAATKGGGLGKVMDMDISKLIEGILTNVDEDKTPELILELLSNTRRGDIFITEEVFNTAYAANFGEMISALKFVLEVNFGGFMAVLDKAANTGQEAPKKSNAAK